MKKILITGIALTSFSAFADWSLKNDKNIYDLMFLSGKGKITSESKITSSKMDDLAYTIGSQNYQTLSAKALNFEETLGYGLLENLELNFGFGYELSNEVSAKYGPASTSNGTTETFKSSGITTPTLSANYRALNQANSFGNLDLSLGFSPKLGTSKDAVNGTKGNSLRDSSLILIGMNFGKKYNDMAWRVGIKESMFGEGKSEDANNSASKSTTKSRNELLIDGSWQWLVQSKYVFNLNIGFGSEDESSSTDSAASTTVIAKKSFTAVGGDFKYLLSENTALGLNISVSAYDKFEIKSGTTTIPVQDYSVTTIGASIKTEF